MMGEKRLVSLEGRKNSVCAQARARAHVLKILQGCTFNVQARAKIFGC